MKIALIPTPLKRGDRISIGNLESLYTRETEQVTEAGDREEAYHRLAVEELKSLPQQKLINNTKFPVGLTFSFEEMEGEG